MKAWQQHGAGIGNRLASIRYVNDAYKQRLTDDSKASIAVGLGHERRKARQATRSSETWAGGLRLRAARLLARRTESDRRRGCQGRVSGSTAGATCMDAL
jgi:hypothetical protein